MELQKLTVEKEKQPKKLLSESQEIDEYETNTKKLAEVDSEIERLQSNLQIADAMVYEGNEQLQTLGVARREAPPLLKCYQ